MSVSEIAADINVSEKRMRAIIREILARRMPAPPEEFVAIQVGRLNDALHFAYGAMAKNNFKGAQLLVRTVRELDRYHGFAAARQGLRVPPPLEVPAQAAMTFAGALVCRPEFAPQGSEMIEFAPGARTQWAAWREEAGASRPDEAALEAALSLETPVSPLAPAAPLGERPENAAQAIEKVDSAPGAQTHSPALREEAPDVSLLNEAAFWAAPSLETPLSPLAPAAPLDERPENASQTIEPRNGSSRVSY